MSGEANETAAPVGAESLESLLSSPNEAALRNALDHPGISEPHICSLLKRRDLSSALIEEIAKRKKWRASYRVRRALAEHAHTPRLIAMRALRELHLMDAVRMSVASGCRADVRRLAEECVLAQLPQLPVGQRLLLALRGSARIAAAIVVQGPTEAARRALDNPFLAESQLLKTLARPELAEAALAIIAGHQKWPNFENVRVALLRHPNLPQELAPALAQNLMRSDLEDLLGMAKLRGSVRDVLRSEITARQERLDSQRA